jgi:mannose/fructose/N-acetylgalactosamine-specific phosphotransferase system component IIC
MSYTDDELKFMAYWEQNRLKEKRLITQLTYGLPIGVIFAVPILVNFLLGRFWYKRADAVGLSQFSPTVLIIAVALISIFVAVLNRKFRWEKLENQYLSLKNRKA